MSYTLLPPLIHHRQHQISSLAFDPVSDVLWSGSAHGNVTAHYPDNARGVAFLATTHGHAVTKLVVTDKDIKAVTESGIGSWGKGGVNKWYFPSIKPLSTFCDHPSIGNTIVIACAMADNPEFIIFNTANGVESRRISAPAMVTHLASSYNLMISAASDGSIRTHDLRSSSSLPQNSAVAHTGGIQDIDVSGQYVYTCGWGYGQSRPVPDPVVKVFDIRNLKSLSPVPFVQGPTHVNVHPKSSTTIAVTSAQGLVSIVDLTNPVTGSEYQQLSVASYISSEAFSPSGAYIVFGDADGYIHQLSSNPGPEREPWNGFEGQPPPWPDPQDPLPNIEWTDSTPLNSIGMPYYDTYLLSSSPQLMIKANYFPPPAKIPEQVLGAIRRHDFLAYAPLPRELRGKRNLAPKEVTKKDEGRFRSTASKRHHAAEEEAASPIASSYPRQEIPRHWRKTDIQYSKFGVEDFDFGYYNKTQYSGLEPHIMNSYTNSMIQALHYSIPLRAHAKSHITTSCAIEHCLLCELGFLSRMLEDGHGTNCQASNFCKVIGRKNQAALLGLIDYTTEGATPDYASMIQQFNRFILEEMATEGNTMPNPAILSLLVDETELIPAPLSQLFGMASSTVITCGSCRTTTERTANTYVVDLVYPRRTPPTDTGAPDMSSFSYLLSTSLYRETIYKTTCQSCKATTNFTSRRVIPLDKLPPMLSVNASAVSEEAMRVWGDKKGFKGAQPFLMSDVVVTVPPQLGDSAGSGEVMYKVRAMVAEVRVAPKNSHLVSIIRVPDAELRHPGESPWYLFNDFVVRNISEEEALGFPSNWKVPCVLILERQDMIGQLNFAGLPSRLDPAILSQQISIARHTDWSQQKHKVLATEEIPTPGTVVAIDAEFVSLQQEETEIRSDGTKKVIRPSLMTLARVSVLRGSGPLNGTPFMDDYIHTTDPIVNYLTEFSGIKFGDLDPMTSRHTLLPLKAVYKKLRLLVDLGCIFVGHGLPKDFRTINLFVPPEQVIDTVDVYFLKERQRRLSLRFLSWYVLQEPIQAVTHDSIEDARAALLLYEKYQQYEEEGRFDDVLDEIYREGKKTNFKPPVEPSEETAPPETTAVIAASVPMQQTHSYPYNSQGYMTPPLQQSPGYEHRDSSRYSSPGWGSPTPTPTRSRRNIQR